MDGFDLVRERYGKPKAEFLSVLRGESRRELPHRSAEDRKRSRDNAPTAAFAAMKRVEGWRAQ